MSGPEFQLVWSPEAETDLLSIWRWGATHFSPETADTHLRYFHLDNHECGLVYGLGWLDWFGRHER